MPNQQHRQQQQQLVNHVKERGRPALGSKQPAAPGSDALARYSGTEVVSALQVITSVHAGYDVAVSPWFSPSKIQFHGLANDVALNGQIAEVMTAADDADRVTVWSLRQRRHIRVQVKNVRAALDCKQARRGAT